MCYDYDPLFLVKFSVKEKSCSDGELSIVKFKKQLLRENGMHKWRDGTIYKGNFLYGKITGKGVMLWPPEATRDDKFFASCSHGNYRILTKDDSVDKFVSKIFKDSKDFTWSDGVIYEGDWLDGKMTGKGVMIWPSGTKYEGEFFENYRRGYGTLTKPTFNVYACGCKIVSSMSDIYEGSWKQGLPEGTGTCTWRNGSIYNGNWRKGKLDGSGIMMWSNGDIFDGCWLNGLMHGQGVYRFANGRIYVGTWSKGIKDGKGTFYYPNDSKKPSLLKKLRAILNYKNPKSKINPSFSEKASLDDTSKNSHDLCRFSIGCKVYEREYKHGVLIKEKVWIIREEVLNAQKNHIIKTKRSDNLSDKRAKKSFSKNIFQDLQSYYLKVILPLCSR